MICFNTTVKNLTDKQADLIVSKLTIEGSDFQKSIINRKKYIAPQCKLSIVEDKGSIVSWASASTWNDIQAYQAFTAPTSRNKGFATLAFAMLVANNCFFKNEPLAVFSQETYKIAAKLGMKHIKLYEKIDGKWISVAIFQKS